MPITRLALLSLLGFTLPAAAPLEGRIVFPDGAPAWISRPSKPTRFSNRCLAPILFLLASLPYTAAAQEFLNERQLLGLRLYNQSCRVCHTKPQLTSQQYAPVLSRASLNGSNDALYAYVANGSAKMPGFKYHFQPHEIDAIVAYLKTVPAPE